MEHTMLMSCVSGGALGASYFRELCLRSKTGNKSTDPYDTEHLEKIAHNTLNPIVFNLVTNDMLLDVNRFRYQGHDVQKGSRVRTGRSSQQAHRFYPRKTTQSL